MSRLVTGLSDLMLNWRRRHCGIHNERLVGSTIQPTGDRRHTVWCMEKRRINHQEKKRTLFFFTAVLGYTIYLCTEENSGGLMGLETASRKVYRK
jgi:hypothetical protein